MTMNWQDNLIVEPQAIRELVLQTKRIVVLGIKTEAQAAQRKRLFSTNPPSRLMGEKNPPAFKVGARQAKSVSAIALVTSAEPTGNTLREIGMSLSKTTMEKVSAPMFARTTPAVFCAFESVTRLAARGEAMMPSTSTPADSTASIKSS